VPTTASPAGFCTRPASLPLGCLRCQSHKVLQRELRNFMFMQQQKCYYLMATDAYWPHTRTPLSHP
jgi:hypothetical protein